MKGDKNILNIHRTLKWRRKQRDKSNYPYNRFRGFYGWSRKTEKQ